MQSQIAKTDHNFFLFKIVSFLFVFIFNCYISYELMVTSEKC